MELVEAIILSVLAASTPLLIAATGELVTERSGVLNLGVEGMMIVGAACGFGGAWLTGSIVLGALCGIAAGMLLSLVFAAMTLGLAVNQVATGLALTILGVGLSGLMGVGRTELLSALYGFEVKGRWSGDVRVGGKPAVLGTVASARRAGIAYVTDDRRGTGLVLSHSVASNVVMSTLRRVTPFGLVSRLLERQQVGEALTRFDVRPRLPAALLNNLSGGNQQKVVFAKELLSEPRLLLLDEPTRGVDVGAKAEIYRQLRELARKGLGVLVASGLDLSPAMTAAAPRNSTAGFPTRCSARRSPSRHRRQNRQSR